ncbi:MAG: transcription termination/antitermination protein NusG [Acutalibacteraceae bacterium]
MAEAKWYVIHTYSGYENKVASNLETVVENRNLHDLIFDIKVPTETVTEIRDNGTKKEVERKIYPGYVMVKMIMNEDSWFVVRNTRGCTGFVGPASTPTPLSEEEVQRLGVEKKTVEVKFKPGDTVTITNGPLEGFSGKVDEIDVEHNSVHITLSMFGKITPVELELSQVELTEE